MMPKKRKIQYNRKWTNLNNKSLFPRCFLLLASVVVLSSCSIKPWQTATLEPFEQLKYEEVVRNIEQQEELCVQGFDADAQITLSNSIQKKSVRGYLAVLAPDKIKFIITTPLGQPFYVATTHQNEFQIIRVPSKSYTDGTLEKLAASYDLSKTLSQIESAEVLNGLLGEKTPSPVTIYADRKERGFWFALPSGDYVLIDPAQRKIVARQTTGDDNETFEIQYKSWQDNSECSKPTEILFSGLSYGAEIDIRLNDIQLQSHFTEKDFTIKIPNGFIKTEK